MKTKIIQFITHLLENWKDEKQPPENRPEMLPAQKEMLQAQNPPQRNR